MRNIQHGKSGLILDSSQYSNDIGTGCDVSSIDVISSAISNLGCVKSERAMSRHKSAHKY